VPSPGLHGALERRLRLQDAATGDARKGWFRCPCHSSTYSDAGVRVFGPAPRSMDRMELTYDRDSDRLIVNTGRITKGDVDNAAHALLVSQEERRTAAGA
jgi:Rieske Fe-S protein